MPATLNDLKSIICPKCGALIIKDFCPKCGYSRYDKEDLLEIDEEQTKEIQSVEGKASLFENKSEVRRTPKIKIHSKKFRIGVAASLILLLSGVCVYYYWLLQSAASTFLSPTADFVIPNAEEGLLVDINTDSEEAIIDFNIGLDEGNFLQYNFAQYAAPEVSIYMQMFGTYDFLKKFYAEDVTQKYLKDLDLAEDDLNVYLSPGFAVVLPDDNFDRWGYTSAIINKKYVEEKISLLENLRDKKKNVAYKDLYAKIVTIKTAAPADSDNETDGENSGNENAEKSPKNSDAAEIVEVNYLLVSNSKEYLDQMKEVSEGVLPNLATSALFAQAQKALPAIGNVMIYRNKKVEFWRGYYEWFGSKFEYEGLNKVLENIESSTIVLYSQAGKLKIAGLSNL